jgi:hypothetical protein
MQEGRLEVVQMVLALSATPRGILQLQKHISSMWTDVASKHPMFVRQLDMWQHSTPGTLAVVTLQ